MPEWRDQIALVTGGSGSIGAAITKHLSLLGARVAWSDINARAETEERLRSDPVDVTNSGAVTEWVDAVNRGWGAPTVGVICAGISRSGRLADMSDADWRDVMAVNLDGAFHTARAIINAMLSVKAGGRIAFVGSWAAHAPHPHIGAYSASKAGLRALCQTLALEHAQDGILINEVAPGIVNGGLSKELFRRDPDLETRTRRAIPTDTLSIPGDVARDVAFFVSPENRQTTGAVLVSDGGLSLASPMNPGRR